MKSKDRTTRMGMRLLITCDFNIHSEGISTPIFVLGFLANLLNAEVLRAQVHLSTVFPWLSVLQCVGG